MIQILLNIVIYTLVLIGLKTIIFGQYWPWQEKEYCSFCKKAK